MKEDLHLLHKGSKSCSTGLPWGHPWTKSDETGQPLVSAGITEVRRDSQKAMFRRSRKKQIRMAGTGTKRKKKGRSHAHGMKCNNKEAGCELTPAPVPSRQGPFVWFRPEQHEQPVCSKAPAPPVPKGIFPGPCCCTRYTG
jgi:hypothetical protein